MIQYPRTAKLVLLLAIDGDRAFRMVDARATVDQADVPHADGASDVDEAALFTILASFVFAYAVRRTTFAREFGVPVKELDGRVEETLLRLVDGLSG